MEKGKVEKHKVKGAGRRHLACNAFVWQEAGLLYALLAEVDGARAGEIDAGLDEFGVEEGLAEDAGADVEHLGVDLEGGCAGGKGLARLGGEDGGEVNFLCAEATDGGFGRAQAAEDGAAVDGDGVADLAEGQAFGAGVFAGDGEVDDDAGVGALADGGGRLADARGGAGGAGGEEEEGDEGEYAEHVGKCTPGARDADAAGIALSALCGRPNKPTPTSPCGRGFRVACITCTQ